VAYLAIGLGIYKFSRFAAIAGVALYWVERIFMFSMQGEEAFTGLSIYLVIIFTFGFVNGIRGTFAYHRFSKIQHATLEPR
jgi:hypothetical protein